MTRRRFTLIELLAVLVIVMILVGVLLPALSTAMKSADKRDAESRLMTLLSAVHQYQAEYRVLPIAGVATIADGDISGDYHVSCSDTPTTPELAVYREFLSLLTNIGSPGNLRGIRFLQPTDQLNGDFLDTWGNPFRVKLDGNYNSQVDGTGIPGLDSSNLVYSAVVITSAGPDGIMSTIDDNLDTIAK